MRYGSKDELLEDAGKEYEALRALLATVPASRREETGVWGDGWTVKDLVAHLGAWLSLFLGWFREGRRGGRPSLPAPGYGWRETPRLNRDLQLRDAQRGWSEVEAELEAAHGEVVELLEELSEAEVMEPGHFAWTGKNGLVTYAGANTASHYRFARKVLRRWLRARPSPGGSGGDR